MTFFIFHLIPYLFPSPILAQTLDPCVVNPDEFPCTVANLEIGGVIAQLINFIFVLAVILALGFLVWGGIKWLTSGGDKENVAGARNTIVAAIIGLIIIFISYVILNFVVIFLTGENLSGIEIPSLLSGGGGAGVEANCDEVGEDVCFIPSGPAQGTPYCTGGLQVGPGNVCIR